MSDAVEAKRYLEGLDEKLKARNPEITLWEQYFEGMHRLQFATSRFRSIFGNLFREFADNWCPLVVEASVERLLINGFRAGTEANEADLEATKIWRDNSLDADYRIAHTEAVKLAHAYVLVDAENKAPETDSPLITIEHPAQAIVMHHPASRRLRLAGLKEWIDENDRLCATLYMADKIYRFEGNEKSGQEEQRSIGWSGLQTGADYLQSPSSQVGYGIEWVPRQGVPFEMENTLKVVPLVPLRNNPTLKGGRSDIAVVIPLQDAVNKTVADMMIASEFASFAQRWATGLEVPKDPQTGRALNNQEFISGPGRVWIAEHPDAKFGQFEASNLQNYVHAVEMLIQHVAALTRTPPHYLLGQALALDTVVPTPTGRRTMEELLVGDLVFDEQGQPQTVEEVFPVLLDEPCYRLTFDDGSEIVADADHKWATSHYAKPRAARDVPRETSVVTTREICNTLKVSGGKDKTAHHFIETCSPLKGSGDLPIDPYVLGIWLGDGDSRAGVITQSAEDADELAELLIATGENVHIRREADKPTIRRLTISPRNGKCKRGHERKHGAKNCEQCEKDRRAGRLGPIINATLTVRLKAAGLIHNKRVPATYLVASHDNRVALLQGLMDSDGHAGANGQVEFTQSEEGLARDVFALAASLGDKPRIASRPHGKKTQFRVTWTPHQKVFRLARKAAAQKVAAIEGHGLALQTSRRYIVGCEPVASVPVRCIRVSGSSKLFLVTDACIATHNSGSFPSGDSLTATETGLVAKVRSKQTDFQVTWNEVMRLAFRAKGSEQANEPIETIWGDPEQRIYSQRVDGALKLSTLGVPQDAIFEEIGKTPQEIARWHAMKRAMAEAEPGSAEAAEHSTLFAIPPAPAPGEKPPPSGPEGNLVQEQAISTVERVARIND